MSYLVDTDRVVDYLKGRPDAVELLNRLIDDGLFVSIITYGEIYEGINFGRDPTANERAFRYFLRGATVLGVSQAVARRFARIRGELRQQRITVPMPDLLIAATAVEHDLTLLTRNLRDFQRIPGLKLESASHQP